MSDFLEKCYEGVMFNVISVTRGWGGGGQISRKKAFRNTRMAPYPESPGLITA